MWYFFAPGTEYLFALIGLGIIVWLIGAGLKSTGGKIFESPKNPPTEEEFRKMKEQLGPMTWKEHVVGVLAIAIFIALIVWLGSIT